MRQKSNSHWTLYFEIGLGLILTCFVVAAVIMSWHWPLIGDAPLFHYDNFLMDRGMAPYRDIAEMNLPGTLSTRFVQENGWAVSLVRCIPFRALPVVQV